MADTSFQIDVGVNAAGVGSAASAVTDLASRLDLAGKASTAAAEAVKEGEAAYKQAESAANRAALAVEKLGIAAQGASGAKLAALTARQAEAAEKAKAATAAMLKEGAALEALEGAARKATKAEEKLTKEKEKQDKALGSGKVNEMGEAFGKLGGPLGSLGTKVFGAAEGFKKMSASLGSAGPYVAVAVAIVAIATAVATVTVAAIAGIAAIGAWAVGLADAARNQELLSDGIAGSVKGGRALDAAIADLETRVPQTTSELQSMAAQLAKTGLEGEDLRNELERTAVEAAKLKFGPDFAKGANSMLKLTERLKANFSKLFGGLKIDALLDKLSSVVDLFKDGSETAEAISVVFNSLFQPLIDGVTAFVPKFIAAFIQFEIWVMKAMIAIKPFGSYIELIAIAFAGLAVIVAAMAVGFTIAVITPFAVIIGLATMLIAAVVQVGLTIASFVGKLSSMSLSEIGTMMIQGLIDGIVGAGSGVLKALTGIVSGAINGVKGLLGIASPSKVFAAIGANTAAGMEEGVDDGASGVQGSMEALAAPPSVAAAGASAAAPAAKGGSTFYITIHGAADTESIMDSFRKAMADLGAQAGTAVPT